MENVYECKYKIRFYFWIKKKKKIPDCLKSTDNSVRANENCIYTNKFKYKLQISGIVLKKPKYLIDSTGILRKRIGTTVQKIIFPINKHERNILRGLILKLEVLT